MAVTIDTDAGEQFVDSTSEPTTAGIDEEHSVERYGGGHYGRPQWKVRFRSNSINARAHVTCESRHEAIGMVPLVKRMDGAEDVTIEYNAEYDN